MIVNSRHNDGYLEITGFLHGQDAPRLYVTLAEDHEGKERVMESIGPLNPAEVIAAIQAECDMDSPTEALAEQIATGTARIPWRGPVGPAAESLDYLDGEEPLEVSEAALSVDQARRAGALAVVRDMVYRGEDSSSVATHIEAATWVLEGNR